MYVESLDEISERRAAPGGPSYDVAALLARDLRCKKLFEIFGIFGIFEICDVALFLLEIDIYIYIYI